VLVDGFYGNVMRSRQLIHGLLDIEGYHLPRAHLVIAFNGDRLYPLINIADLLVFQLGYGVHQHSLPYQGHVPSFVLGNELPPLGGRANISSSTREELSDILNKPLIPVRRRKKRASTA